MCWKLLLSYKVRAQLTPTLTHIVTYELVTSGAEDNAMSGVEGLSSTEAANSISSLMLIVSVSDTSSIDTEAWGT